MAEKEYIERESAYPLAKKLCDAVISGSPEQIFLGRYILDWIDEIHAADVRPVKRGNWIDHQEGRWIYAKCSECGTVHDVKSNFCPNCGADMREGS